MYGNKFILKNVHLLVGKKVLKQLCSSSEDYQKRHKSTLGTLKELQHNEATKLVVKMFIYRSFSYLFESEELCLNYLKKDHTTCISSKVS